MTAATTTAQRPTFPRRRARAAAVVAALALALGLVPATADAAPARAADGAVSISVSPTSVQLTPGHDLTLTVRLANTSSDTIDPGTVTVALGTTPLTSRDAVEDWLDTTDAAASGPSVQVQTSWLYASETTTLTAVIPAAEVASVAGAWGPRGISATFASGESTGTGHGVVVWYDGAVTPTPVTVALPMTAPVGSTGLLDADDLAALTRPGGLLTRELDGIMSRPVAVGIDPMIIASVRALGTSAPASATAWLERLAAFGGETFALAWADSDLALQAQGGHGFLSPTSLAYALDPANFPEQPQEQPTPTPTPTAAPSAVPSLEQLTAWDYTATGVAWPGRGTLRGSDLGPLADAGYTTVIASDADLADAPATTTRAAASASDVQLALADDRVSAALTAAETAVTDADWQSSFSEAAALLAVASVDGGSGPVLAALDRGWPATSSRLPQTLDGLFNLPWADAAPFSSALAAPATAVALDDKGERQERVDALGRLLDDESRLAQFATALTDPAVLTGRERNAILGLLAVGWRGEGEAWSTAVADHRAATASTLASVSIAPSSEVLVVGSPTEILFTVKNDFTSPVNVHLHVVPSNGRLVIDSDADATIEAGSSATVRIPVRAQIGSGEVLLTATLTSPSGVQLGVPSSVMVNVQADWEGLGAIVIGTLVVLMFGIGLWRSIRRRRRERAAEDEGAADEGEAGASPDATDATETPDGSDEPTASSELEPPDADRDDRG